MYRSLLTCLILCLVHITTGYGHFHHRHDHHFGRHNHHHFGHHNHYQPSATEIVQSFVEAEGALKNLCTTTSKIQPSINYGDDACVIKYTLTTTDVNFDIKIINKVLMTSVTKKNNNNDYEVNDVRVLPDILNFNQASGEFSKNNLKIVIPYNVPFNTDLPADCGVVNNNVITVTVQDQPNFQYRTSRDDN
ncbi:unnamed protein product [Euphydryas editha]|uniref:Uncharacterized protein n=1 Tax=Euphydryas editha TaxID=104508 RepID=A0AAU9US85_EUPED|nr:unnamed protein product [Euphydryas editha]